MRTPSKSERSERSEKSVLMQCRFIADEACQGLKASRAGSRASSAGLSATYSVPISSTQKPACSRRFRRTETTTTAMKRRERESARRECRWLHACAMHPIRASRSHENSRLPWPWCCRDMQMSSREPVGIPSIIHGEGREVRRHGDRSS